MAEDTPVVYILHGDDEFAIARFVSELESRLGDPATAAMNISRLEGNTFNPDDWLSIAGAVPFLATRRLVVLVNVLGRFTSPSARDKFGEQLLLVPASTALVIVENRLLTTERDRRAKKLHWLEKWAAQNPRRAFVRVFNLPRGAQMAKRIRGQASQSGGQITLQAAELLASLVDGDPRLAEQEIQKLLAYVDYKRPIEADDVELLTADQGQGNIFAMVDALGNQNSRQALGILHRLLEQQDPIPIFGMVVRQFRLLLLAREILDHGGNRSEISRAAKTPLFVADKLIVQARRFSLPDLEGIFRRLLDVDEAIKTGQMPGDLALDVLFAALTSKSG